MLIKKKEIDLFYQEQSKLMRYFIQNYQFKQTDQLSKQLIQINFLVLGLKKAGKTSLINTFKAAFKNSKQIIQKPNSNDLGLVKTQLRKFKKFIVQTQTTKEFQGKPAINIFQYNDKITTKQNDRLLKIISNSDYILEENFKTIKQAPKFPLIHSIIFCVKLGQVLSAEQTQSITNLLVNIKLKKFKPIIALTHLDSIDRTRGQTYYSETLQNQILRIQKLFAVSRQQITPIQCYHQGSSISGEINYYALCMLHNALKRSKQFQQNKTNIISKKNSFFAMCGC